MTALAIAVLHYPGGKACLASWIADLLPPPGSYRVFIDVFGGAASMLLEIMRRNDADGVKAHYVYNDKDEELVNFFRVLRDSKMRDELREMLRWTPYSRKEFRDCIEMPVAGDPVKRAWRFFTLTQQKFAGGRATPGRWGCDTGGKAVSRWLNSQERLDSFGEMFRRVQVECLDFAEILKRYDGKDILVYLDPPYFPGSRVDPGIYDLELPRERHEELAGLLDGFSGMAALSGYRCPEYDEWYAGWERHDREVPCHISGVGSTGERKGLSKPRRIESLWLNRLAVASRKRIRQISFSI
ncbi:MAG: DNA adenine methylase [Bacillota bacterium]|nr:DNA adenine methylase [Bacillota bacterium]